MEQSGFPETNIWQSFREIRFTPFPKQLCDLYDLGDFYEMNNYINHSSKNK